MDLYLAKTIAQRWIDQHWGESSTHVVICDHLTRERPFGWVFFYQSAEYLQSKDPKHQLVGNAPLIVDRADGSVHLTGTLKPLDEYIAEYEKRGAAKR